MATNFSNVLLRFDGRIRVAEGSTPVNVRGSNGADTVTIEQGVVASLSASFNRGNDVVNFTGLASSYTITKSGSSNILITDASGTSVTIPVGTAGITINFADASRTLVGGASGITLGNQAVTDAPAGVAAGTGVAAPFPSNDQEGVLPGASDAQRNTVVLQQGARVNLGEGSDPTVIRGTNGIDVVEVAEGSVLELSASFNRGNDIIRFSGLAEDYQIVRNGSSSVTITDDAGTSVTIPVGVAGTAIEFADVSRTLVAGPLATGGFGLFLGDQLIGATPADIAEGGTGLAANIFTLTEIENTPPSSEAEEPNLVVFWGYNPNGVVDGSDPGNPEEGPANGGIPLSTLVEFVTTITGLDLADLGLIDDDGSGPFDNVTNISISNATSLNADAEADDGSTANAVPVQLILDFSDGTQGVFNIEAQIAELYFDFLNDLLFDSEGNSRLFLVDLNDFGSGEQGPDSGFDRYTPIVLTPSENNGGTIETGFTSSADDTIVVGRLELLHQAYIDGGAGFNVLEIDAKGVYAQPLQLLNIQEIRVTDLPDFYTVPFGDGEGNLSNTEFDGAFPSPTGENVNGNTWIDLTRAAQLETLVISDQGNDFTVDDDGNRLATGDLTIVGVRNSATLRLEGSFDSGATTVQYADVDPDGLTVILNIGNVSNDGDTNVGGSGNEFNILQNSATLNIVSEGTSNFMEDFFAGGNLTNLNISGTGRFGVSEDMDESFVDDTPIVIDASQNSGGVDLTISGSQSYTIFGSSGDDSFDLQTSDDDGGSINDETVTIDGGEGNNYYEIDGAEVVSITNGDGNNNYEIFAGDSAPGLPAVGELTIVTGNGDNKFELTNIATVALTAGDGDNRVDLTSSDSFDYTDPTATPDWVSNVDIDFGDGDNRIYIQASTDSSSRDAGVVDIDVGSGQNEIAVSGKFVDISTTGTGPNVIYALGSESVTIANAASNGSLITVAGDGGDFAQMINELAGNSSTTTPVDGPNLSINDTVLLNIQAGTGATVALGLEGESNNGVTLTALPGSVISGTDLTLNVRTVADIRGADISGVTSVVIDDDNFQPGDSPTANSAIAGGNAAVLVLTSEQFLEIGAENFSVDGALFNTHGFIKIVVTESTSLTALGVDDLPRNIDLILEIADGVTLTMTAEQLHTRVAQEGVLLANDGNTDLASGRVIITGGGINFDPYNTSDTVQTDIAGTLYVGGSLSSDFGELGASFNVTVRSTVGGYNRPADPESTVVLTIDSAVTPVVEGFVTFHNALEIVGSQDVTFNGPVELGVISGSSTANDRPFEIDFSALEGNVVNFVVDNFEYLAQGGGIFGNSDIVGPVEVFVSIATNSGTGSNDDFGWDEADSEPLVSEGVTKYTVLTIEGAQSPGSMGGTATITLNDTVEDLEVVALRGNYNDILDLNNLAWGINFELQGGGTLKADGPTGTSNVGVIDASYAFPGADAVVDIVHSNPADTRPILAAGLVLENAGSLTINAPDSDTTLASLTADDDLTDLVVTGSGDVTIGGELPDSLTTVDFSGVDGVATFEIDSPGLETPVDVPTVIIGGAGGSVIALEDIDGGEVESISGAGPITLVIDDSVDLSETELTNVVSVVLEDGATLSLTVAQADAIGAENFSLAPGADDANLSLAGLGEEPFSLADYADGISVSLVSVVDQPTVTLDPTTDLTGIGGLMVPEGVTLNLTAEQFNQLTTGAITIINTDGNAANDAINVNITDLTQAEAAGFDLSDVNVGGGTLTVAISGDVTLAASANLGSAEVIIPDDTKLTLATLQQAALEDLGFFTGVVDGRVFIGGAGSVLEIAQATGATGVNIDASGFGVETLRLPALLVSNNNVDFLFEDLPAAVTKVIFEGVGDVEGRLQNVIVEEGVTIFGNISFNDYQLDTEVTNVVLNLQGGSAIDGDLVLSTVQVNEDTVELVPTYLQTLTINSTGTDANTINGETANVISGDVTPGAFPAAVGIGSRDNNLKNVIINASQDLVIEGSIIFSSHGDDAEGTLENEPDDGITANDDDSAIAELLITGDSDVSIGRLDTSDGDIDGVNVVNSGTGTLTTTLDFGAGLVDDEDALSFTGTGPIELTVIGAGDLTDDVIDGVTSITIADNSVVSLTQDQVDALGAENILTDGTPVGAELQIVGFDGGPFDSGDFAPGIDVTLVVSSDVTLDGTFDGVSIQVVEGNTLTLTAAQYNQIALNGGTITVIDGPDAGTGVGSIDVVITDLTQADIDAGDDIFDLGAITVGTGGSVDISLGEAQVDLGTFVDMELEAGSSADIVTADGVKASFTLTDGQTLGVTTLAQTGAQAFNPLNFLTGDDVAAIVAGGPLTVSGTGFTVLEFKFVPPLIPGVGQIDASGYDVSELRVLASTFGLPLQSNVEFVIDDLDSDVALVLYETPEQLGFLDETFRIIRVEEGITTGSGLIFNDFDFADEVRAVDLTLEGDVTINGDIAVPTRVDPFKDDELIQQFFEQLTIRSTGDDTNTINGGINAQPTVATTTENNLLLINIVADQDLVVTGPVVFSAVGNGAVGGGDDQVAVLNITGDADVTIKALDTTDGDVSALVINHNGTGTLTITGGSDSLQLDSTGGLTVTGTGDVVLDTDTGPGNNGVEGNALSSIDASALTGDFTVGVIEDVNGAAFSFIAGTGVTTATLIDSDLNSLGADNAVGGTGPDADTAGWSIDFTDAAAGSQFRLDGSFAGAVDGSQLSIHMGPNAQLFIDETMDLSDLDLEISGDQPIVLADGVTLTLTAAQADGLTIIPGPNTGAPGFTGQVVIVDLGDDPVDLSGLSAAVNPVATLEDDDVTLDPATDLGAVALQLADVFGNSNSLAGQTIRFTTVEQADGREITVSPNGGAATSSSVNVVWLFDDIPGTDPIDTGDYDLAIGRLFISPTLINNEGGDVEQLFTTLPSTILRVEFPSLTELDILLASNPVNRVVEFVHFTEVGDLTFSDVGSSPDEFLSSLTLRLGGDVSIGDIDISDVVGGADVDPETTYFNQLTIDSIRAVERISNTVGEILAAESYRNDNDGQIEEVVPGQNENSAPDAPNVIGDITGDDTNDQIDLLLVNIRTNLERTTDTPEGMDVTATGGFTGSPGNNRNNDRGEALVVGTITFDSSGDMNPLSDIMDPSTATLDIEGANDVTIEALDTSDADIVNLVIDLTDFTAVLDPVLLVDNTETVTITNSDATEGTAIFQDVQGDELSIFDASEFDGTLFATLSQIDSSNDTDVTPGDTEAFTFTAGAGQSIITVTQVGTNTPTLSADSEWVFDFSASTGGINNVPTPPMGEEPTDSRLIIDESVVFAADSTLTLIDAPTYITGDVDLSEINLNITNTGGADNMRFYVGAGSTLTLSVEQVLALGDVEIVGEGTVKLVGDATDVDGATLGAQLFTGIVDASDVTIALTGTDPDDDETFDLVLNGALAFDGATDIGQTVIGTDFDDNLRIIGQDAALDYTFDGGAGDDTYRNGGPGDHVYLVTEDTDTIFRLRSEGPNPGSDDANQDNDVLVVSAGATAIAFVRDDFIATAETSNAGTTFIYEDDTPGNNSDPFDPLMDLDPAGPLTVDLSLAGGPNGYNVTMATDDIIIGSAFDDVLDGGNLEFTGTVDILTGNGGADDFVFQTQLADSAALTATTESNIDRELLTLTADDVDENTEAMVVNLTINGVAVPVIVDLTGVDTTNLAQLRNAVITSLNGTAGVLAVAGVGADEVIVSPTGSVVNGNLEGVDVDITGDTGGALAGVWSEPAAPPQDEGQVTTVTVSGTPTPGDIYTVLLTLQGGGGDNATFEAVTDDPIDVAAGLAADLAGAGFTVTYVAGDNFFTITDDVPDNGGFSVDLDTDAAFGGSGASSINLTGALADLDTADIITDFNSAEGDEIILGLPSGAFTSNTGEVATYADAFAAATGALDGSAMFFYVGVEDYDGAEGTGQINGQEGGGLLFFDANLDGDIDGVIIIEQFPTLGAGDIA